MEKKKHYNKGQVIALTFPVPKERLEQEKLNKKMKEELAVTKKQNEEQAKQNEEQAELIAELKQLVKNKKGKSSDNQ